MKNDIEFWQSKDFWLTACLVLLIGIGVTILATLAISVDAFNVQRHLLTYRGFVYRAASGEKIDDRSAWPDYMYALRYGQYLYSQKTKGIDLDGTLKHIADVRNDIQNKRESDRPAYEHFLAERLGTPWILIEMTKGKNWMEMENNPEDMKILRRILVTGKLDWVRVEPVWKLNKIFGAVLLLIVQLLAYLLAFGKFKESIRGHSISHSIRLTRLTFGGFITLLLFSTGAWPAMTIQAVMVGKYRVRNYISERREAKEHLIKPSLGQTDSRSQEDLL